MTSRKLTRKLTPKALIDKGFSSVLSGSLSGSEDLAIFLSNSNGVIDIDSKSVAVNMHETYWIDYIHAVVEMLDLFIDLDFIFTDTPDNANILIYQVPYVDGLDNAVVGRAAEAGDKWIVQYEVSKDSSRDMNTILYDLNTFIHEFGHTLGLRHPFNNPYDKRYNTSDTAMSYNIPMGSSLSPYFFTKSDVGALGAIWGFEDESNSGRGLYDAAQLGTAGADVLTGGRGLDALYGLEGDDTLINQGYGDFLFGGAGSDSFILAPKGYAQIKDIEAQDKVIVRRSGSRKSSDVDIWIDDNGLHISAGEQTIATYEQPGIQIQWDILTSKSNTTIQFIESSI